MALQLGHGDPDYVKFLLSPELEYDCYFVVGNPVLTKQKRIGVVKMMLLAHSPVFRAELQSSKLREKGDVFLEDFYPDTFKHLLRYVYGYDNTSTLTFDEADNLLYAAEKYMMDAYKQKLATRLMTLLNVDNICSLLNNPACFRVLELDAAITKILQYETDKVLASPLFLGVSPEAFVKILEQDAMNVPEIEVWRAAIRWAKEKTGSEDGQVLRQLLSDPLKKIRVCTLSFQDLCTEVVTEDVLTDSEFKHVCKARGTKAVQESLVNVCNLIGSRKRAKPLKTFTLDFSHHKPAGCQSDKSSMVITTKNRDIELLPMEFFKKLVNARAPVYLCECTIEIAEIGPDNSCSGHSVTVKYCESVEYNKPFRVPITYNRQNARLFSHRRYRLRVSFREMHRVYVSDKHPASYDNDHVSVCLEDVDSSGNHSSHIKWLQYQGATED